GGQRVRRGVAEPAHRVQHELALRGQAVAARSQLPLELSTGHPSMIGRCPTVDAVTRRVVGVLGGGLVDPEAPLVRADDAGLLRGDGCFESILVRAGAPVWLDAHLARLAASARRLELPPPELDSWRALIGQVVAAWGRPDEAVLRLVLTRGPE